MNCIYCQRQMKRSKTPFHVDRNGYHLVLDTVPAWICHQYSKAYFEEREVDAIQSVIKGLDQQTRQLVTDPWYELTGVATMVLCHAEWPADAEKLQR